MSPELEQIRHDVEQLTKSCPEDAWHLAPPGKWSCAQIMEHLRLSYTGTTKGLQRLVHAGQPQTKPPTLSDRMRAIAVTRLGFMPKGRVSPANLTPQQGLELDALRRFYDALVAMDATLADAERRFGNKVKLLDHPFLGPLDVRQWRKFHRVHARHHLRQMMQRVRETRPTAASGRLH